MDLGITGRAALVTGASSGLGEASATALTAEGVHVTINSRNDERLRAAAERIAEKTGRRPELLVGDVTDPAWIDSQVQHLRRFDILVANTGGPAAGRFMDLTREHWESAWRLLCMSAQMLTHAVLGGMVERTWGRLVYITSLAAMQPIDDLILSNSCRAAITGMCKTISNTYASHGITANTVCPGYTATERLQELAVGRAKALNLSREHVIESFAAQNPTGRICRPDEVGAVVAFLASEPAASITGSSVAVDGGAHKGLF